jgi:hypothetical protein
MELFREKIMQHGEKVICPTCQQSDRLSCWDEQTRYFKNPGDPEEEAYEMPMGYFSCGRCQTAAEEAGKKYYGFAHTFADQEDEYLGTFDADYGWDDRI